MAEEGSDGQEKTEDPSQRKIDKSLEEGKVLKSQEVNILTSMAAGFALMFACSGLCEPYPRRMGIILSF
jgi:flagellar biosynthetic protein FlhB